MIFKQVREIIDGTKTQTRRIKKMSEVDDRTLCRDASDWHDLKHIKVPNKISGVFSGSDTGNLRIKWQVGRKYAVVPKRGMPQVYYKYVTSHTGEARPILAHDETEYGTSILESVKLRVTNWKHELECYGYKPLYIELTDIRCEPLQDITQSDALAEGCSGLWNADKLEWSDYVEPQYRYFRPNPIAQYIQLWESINGEGSWQQNPDVWVLEFKAVSS